MKQRDIRLGVVGGHINAAVTEDEACLIQGHAIPQHLRGRGVTEQVRTLAGASMLARLRACFTTEETPSPEANGLYGALLRMKT